MGTEGGAEDGEGDRESGMKKSFVMYNNLAKLIVNLPTAQAGELIRAICNKELGNDVSITDPYVAGMFDVISQKLDEDEQLASRERR